MMLNKGLHGPRVFTSGRTDNMKIKFDYKVETWVIQKNAWQYSHILQCENKRCILALKYRGKIQSLFLSEDDDERFYTRKLYLK